MNYLSDEFLTDVLKGLYAYKQKPGSDGIFANSKQFFQFLSTCTELSESSRAIAKACFEAFTAGNNSHQIQPVNVYNDIAENLKQSGYIKTHPGFGRDWYIFSISATAMRLIQNKQPFNFSPNTNQPVHNTTISGNNITVGSQSPVNIGNANTQTISYGNFSQQEIIDAFEALKTELEALKNNPQFLAQHQLNVRNIDDCMDYADDLIIAIENDSFNSPRIKSKLDKVVTLVTELLPYWSTLADTIQNVDFFSKILPKILELTKIQIP